MNKKAETKNGCNSFFFSNENSQAAPGRKQYRSISIPTTEGGDDSNCTGGPTFRAGPSGGEYPCSVVERDSDSGRAGFGGGGECSSGRQGGLGGGGPGGGRGGPVGDERGPRGEGGGPGDGGGGGGGV